MKRIFIDLDNTTVDYTGAAIAACEKLGQNYVELRGGDGPKPWLVPGFYKNLKPMPKAIETIEQLFKNYDCYILSTSPWSCPWAAAEKMEWVKENLPIMHKRVILTHHKELFTGDYLIDDMDINGADQFNGEHIKFGTAPFENWENVSDYLLK